MPVELALVHPPAVDAAELLRLMADRAHRLGYVHDGFADAVVAREARFPTGLPTAVPAALPHADAVHVRRAGTVLALLAEPVSFGEMGSVDRAVPARLVVMLLVDDPQAQVDTLTASIAALQDPGLGRRLDAVRGPADLVAAVHVPIAGG